MPTAAVAAAESRQLDRTLHAFSTPGLKRRIGRIGDLGFQRRVQIAFRHLRTRGRADPRHPGQQMIGQLRHGVFTARRLPRQIG